MSTKKSPSSIDFRSDIATPDSLMPLISESDTLDLQSSQPKTSKLESQPPYNSSIWKIPGLDKETFYAAALYLHVVAGELEEKLWFRESSTPEATRDFLDRLADCFARSKLQDARDHVSATAMVRTKGQKKITLYIAKNQSNKGCERSVSQEDRRTIANENDDFAKALVKWFTDLASKGTDDDKIDDRTHIFTKMCTFSWSRLEHYLGKICESDIDGLERVVTFELGNDGFGKGWELAKSLIETCNHYQESKSKGADFEDLKALAGVVQKAGETRQNLDFRLLTYKFETSTLTSKLKALAEVVKWINYLGRLYAAYVSFYEFCRDKEQRGYVFDYQLLASQEDEWSGGTYIKKVQSWTGDLGLTEVPDMQVKTVEQLMKEIVQTNGNRSRVHCEMQLMMHFLQSEEECLDYFGCSKKSCWLCWQMMSQNSKHSMKGTHRKLYPRWAFPFEFSLLPPAVAEGVRVAYNDMLRFIQTKAIWNESPSSIESYPQSSARITPHHRRPRTNNNTGSGLFSGNVITIQDKRMPAMEFEALHLFAGDSHEYIREVKVHAFKKDEMDLNESFMPSQYLPDSQKRISYAFQLLTSPKSLGPNSGVDEYQEAFWNRTKFTGDLSSLGSPGSPGTYEIWSRSAETLTPNPYLVSIWRETHERKPENFPWRGHIFIIQKIDKNQLLGTPIESFSRALRRYFENCPAEFVTQKYKSLLRRAMRGLELYHEWVKL